MSHKAWDRGDSVRLTANFRDYAGALADPTQVFFKYMQPDSATPIVLEEGVDAALVKTSTGIFYVNLSVAIEGIWRWRFEGIGVVVAASEGTLAVKDSQFYAA